MLSLLCITNNQFEGTGKFIERMRADADILGAEFVLGLDREKAQTADFRKLADKAIDLQANTLQEDVMNYAVSACSGDWILRLDDDETISASLLKWLTSGEYQQGVLYSFPRVYLYPDEHYYLVNDGIFPDLQTRLGKKPMMYGFNYIHAGNPNGAGVTINYALEHHKLLVRNYDQRKAIADHYEGIRKGAGSLPQYARYNLPELFYDEMEVKEYTDGDFCTR